MAKKQNMRLEDVLTVEEEILDGKPVYILLDTGAITNLYHTYGETFFDELKDDAVYIITDGVKEEIEKQYKGRDCLDDVQCEVLGLPERTRKVPYELMNKIWENLDGYFEEVSTARPEEYTDAIKQSMAEGSSDTGNTRIGQGDISILHFAEEFSPERVVLVSPDSDIPNTLSAMNLENTTYLTEEGYAHLTKLDRAA